MEKKQHQGSMHPDGMVSPEILREYRDTRKKMEATSYHIVQGYIGVILGLFRDNGREHGNY